MKFELEKADLESIADMALLRLSRHAAVAAIEAKIKLIATNMVSEFFLKMSLSVTMESLLKKEIESISGAMLGSYFDSKIKAILNANPAIQQEVQEAIVRVSKQLRVAELERLHDEKE